MCNSARFINSSDYQHKPNCKPVIGIFENEASIILVSTTFISAGTETIFKLCTVLPFVGYTTSCWLYDDWLVIRQCGVKYFTNL